MSTRCNVKIQDSSDHLWFYRHSDGYPEGTLPTLKKFMGWVKEGKIRDNVEQASGWLIIIGAEEYEVSTPDDKDKFAGWKVGAYEPAICEHGDIEYLYTLDLVKLTITVKDLYNKTEKTITVFN